MSSTTIRSFVALDLPSEAQDFLEELINEEKNFTLKQNGLKESNSILRSTFFMLFLLVR